MIRFTLNKINNRYLMIPMLTPVGTTYDGTFTNEAVEYFVRRARGGIGLIITGANLADNKVARSL